MLDRRYVTSQLTQETREIRRAIAAIYRSLDSMAMEFNLRRAVEAQNTARVKELMTSHSRLVSNAFAESLLRTVQRVGERLRTMFPAGVNLSTSQLNNAIDYVENATREREETNADTLIAGYPPELLLLLIGLPPLYAQRVMRYNTILVNNPANAGVLELRGVDLISATPAELENAGRALQTAISPAEIRRMTRAFAVRLRRQHADLVADTLAAGAVNGAINEVVMQGIEGGHIPADTQKIWHTNIDGKERSAHNGLNGARVSAGSPFLSTLGEIRFPGDPQAVPENTARCRCICSYE